MHNLQGGHLAALLFMNPWKRIYACRFHNAVEMNT